jgi:hypothetical protein
MEMKRKKFFSGQNFPRDERKGRQGKPEEGEDWGAQRASASAYLYLANRMHALHVRRCLKLSRFSNAISFAFFLTQISGF